MMAVLVRTAHRTSHLTRAANPQLRLIVMMYDILRTVAHVIPMTGAAVTAGDEH
jgi:hypothetical protein